MMNTYAAEAERRKLVKTRALVLALSVILAAAWQVACGGGTGGIDTGPDRAPVASIAPGSLAFGNQTMNTESTAQTVTLSNTGNAALAKTRGRVSGPSGAAARLGIPPSTLESRIRAMNINKYCFKAF
jgi:hypothetical protein